MRQVEDRVVAGRVPNVQLQLMGHSLTIFHLHDMRVVIRRLGIHLLVTLHRLLSEERIDYGGLSDVSVAHKEYLSPLFGGGNLHRPVHVAAG